MMVMQAVACAFMRWCLIAMMVGNRVMCSACAMMACRFFVRDCGRVNRARDERENKNQAGDEKLHKSPLSRDGLFGQIVRHSGAVSMARRKSSGIGIG